MKSISVSSATFCMLISSVVVADDLPSMNLDTNAITVSGLSSGGFMASQFHLAHSSWVAGAALLASGPVYCAQNSITTALERCVDKVASDIPLAELNQQIAEWANSGKIDDTANLRNDKVWFFHGTRDNRVNKDVTQALITQYAQFVSPENLVAVTDKPIPHVFPTLNKGNTCIESTSPFIGACEYDAAGAMLGHILNAKPAANDEATGRLITLDQQALGGSDANTIANEGYLYVPAVCEQGETCQVHISFHGCNQNAEAVGTAYAQQTGLNRWADTNHHVILYPQTKKSMFLPLNPQACWDWWGYTGTDYATKDGKQIKAVTNIINALSAKQDNS